MTMNPAFNERVGLGSMKTTEGANKDRVLALHDSQRDVTMLAVADGVSSHRAGGEIAQHVVGEMESQFHAHVQSTKPTTSQTASDWLSRAIRSAHEFGLENQAKGRDKASTTLSLALIHKGVLYPRKAGDSPIFHATQKDGKWMVRQVLPHELTGFLGSNFGGDPQEAVQNHPPVQLKKNDWVFVGSDGVFEEDDDVKFEEHFPVLEEFLNAHLTEHPDATPKEFVHAFLEHLDKRRVQEENREKRYIFRDDRTLAAYHHLPHAKAG